MNLDLWLVFYGALLIVSLPGVGAILTFNHAFPAGMAQDAAADCRLGHTELALMVTIAELSTEALRASATAWLLLKVISAFWLHFAAYRAWRALIIMDDDDVVALTCGLQQFCWSFLTE